MDSLCEGRAVVADMLRHDRDYAVMKVLQPGASWYGRVKHDRIEHLTRLAVVP